MQTVVLRPHVAVKHFSATCACFFDIVFFVFSATHRAERVVFTQKSSM